MRRRRIGWDAKYRAASVEAEMSSQRDNGGGSRIAARLRRSEWNTGCKGVPRREGRQWLRGGRKERGENQAECMRRDADGAGKDPGPREACQKRDGSVARRRKCGREAWEYQRFGTGRRRGEPRAGVKGAAAWKREGRCCERDRGERAVAAYEGWRCIGMAGNEPQGPPPRRP